MHGAQTLLMVMMRFRRRYRVHIDTNGFTADISAYTELNSIPDTVGLAA